MVFISIPFFFWSVVAVVEWMQKAKLTQNYTILCNILCYRRKIPFHNLFIFGWISSNIQYFMYNIKHTARYLDWIVYAFRCQYQMDLHFSWEIFRFPLHLFSSFIELKATRVQAFLSHFTSRLHFYCSLIQNILILYWKNGTENRFWLHFPKSECE